MSPEPERKPQFFYEEIDVTPYFLKTLPDKLKNITHKELRSISLQSTDFKGTNNVYLCIYRESVKLAAVVSISCSFNIQDITGSIEKAQLTTNEYETDVNDVKCTNPFLKEAFVDCINKLKEEILLIYLKEERSKLFDRQMSAPSPAIKPQKERFKNKFSYKYKLTFHRAYFLDILFKPEFVNCYSKILNRNNFEMELETHKIVTYQLGFHDILSKKQKFDETNPLIFYIVKDNKKYEINIFFGDNLVIEVYTNEEESEFIENDLILKPFEVFKQKLIKL